MTWYNEPDRLGVERENAFMKTYTYAGDYSNIETRDPLLEEGILSGQYGTLHFKQCINIKIFFFHINLPLYHLSLIFKYIIILDLPFFVWDFRFSKFHRPP